MKPVPLYLAFLLIDDMTLKTLEDTQLQRTIVEVHNCTV